VTGEVKKECFQTDVGNALRGKDIASADGRFGRRREEGVLWDDDLQIHMILYQHARNDRSGYTVECRMSGPALQYASFSPVLFPA
jgi:hypothetical protein